MKKIRKNPSRDNTNIESLLRFTDTRELERLIAELKRLDPEKIEDLRIVILAQASDVDLLDHMQKEMLGACSVLTDSTSLHDGEEDSLASRLDHIAICEKIGFPYENNTKSQFIELLKSEIPRRPRILKSALDRIYSPNKNYMIHYQIAGFGSPK